LSLTNEQIEKLKKVLELEKRTGYQNTAVMGGIEGLVQNTISESDAQSLVSAVDGYNQMDLPKRRAAIEEFEELLLGEEVHTPSQSARPKSKSNKQTAPKLDIHSPVRFAKGVGEQRGKQLEKLGIETIQDLLFYLPRKLEDRSVIKKIGDARQNEYVTVKARIRAIDLIKPRKNLEILKLAVQDNTGVLFVTFFNQPWLKSQFAQGERISLYGQIEKNYGGVNMNSPVWEPESTNFLTGRIVPIYPVTKGLTAATLYRLIRNNFEIYQDEVEELLPEEIRTKYKLLSRRDALSKIHFADSQAEFEHARRSLAFEELLLFQIGVALQAQEIERAPAPVLEISEDALARFHENLPFRLTSAQERVIEEIRRDLASGYPMNRLLQGDVGSGKTVVAAAAAFIAASQGAQSALMAPTEILAQQHHLNIQRMLAPLGVKSILLVGSLTGSERAETAKAIEHGAVDVVVGTHALISQNVKFKNLQLALIDEQQRFGVIQRGQLEEKGNSPHVLVMSATPIPRTITLTIYGQFDVSIIDELPFKKDIKTYWVSEDKRDGVYKLIADEMKKGVQAYIVYPLVEESEELDLRAAVTMKEELEQTHFSDFNVGLLHGRMSDEEKRTVMEQLNNKEIDLLVSTSIIEVGIDVPDASLMVLEHANRFGLSQLHQLRGRIGRQGQSSLCFAIANVKTEEGRQRMEAFRDNLDGFEIAEQDLRIRGTGELLGVAQHGLDTTFKVADLIRDFELMKAARDEAREILQSDPQTPLINEFEKRLGDRFDLARI